MELDPQSLVFSAARILSISFIQCQDSLRHPLQVSLNPKSERESDECVRQNDHRAMWFVQLALG